MPAKLPYSNRKTARRLRRKKFQWTCKDIAELLGVSPAWVYKVTKDIPSRVGKGVVWDDEVDLGSIPDVELAARHGLTPDAAAKARRRRGIPPCEPWAQDRARARELYAEGRTVPEIAYLLDRSWTAVHRWVTTTGVREQASKRDRRAA